MSLPQTEKQKCPKFLGIFTRHTWGKEDWRGLPDPTALNLSPYIAKRECKVCGQVQLYYQGGASAGWEDV